MKSSENIKKTHVSYIGTGNNKIVGDRFECPAVKSRGRTVILLHGGGQTRHSWDATAKILARRGFTAIAIDQRGHGDSDWADDGDYTFDAFAGDLNEICKQYDRPVVVGASLGGMASMLAEGRAEHSIMSSLVLVDITPFMKRSGVHRILGFMGDKAIEGFASLEEAADAISSYLPHRPKPKDLSGLSKNLRKTADGRYRWHWDPKFVTSRKAIDSHTDEIEAQLRKLAAGITIPVLLIRGRDSELVGEDEAEKFMALLPHAKLTDVTGARHMVSGDKNDVFCDALVEFLG